jgi:hypothetical protein
MKIFSSMFKKIQLIMKNKQGNYKLEEEELS